MKRTLDPNLTANVKTISADSFSSNIQMISLEKLTENKENFYSLSEIEILAEDIDRQGLRHNLVVSANGDGTYRIISGHRRYAAVKLLCDRKSGTNLLPCYVAPPTDDADNELENLIMLNATSRVMTDGEMMKQAEKLRGIFERKRANGKIKGRERDYAAKILGVSASQIKKIDNIEHNAISEVKAAVESGEMSISTANEAAKLDEKEQKEMLVSKPISKISHKEVKEKLNENKNCGTCTTIFGVWSNGACLGYAIKTCEILGYSEQQTNDFVKTLKYFFDEITVEQAQELYGKSRY